MQNLNWILKLTRRAPYSLRSLMLHPILGATVRDELGQRCAEALKELFVAGETLGSQLFRSERVRASTVIPVDSRGERTLYHASRWGDDGLLRLFNFRPETDPLGRLRRYRKLRAQALLFPLIFRYLRVERQLSDDNPLHHWKGLWLRNFYLGITPTAVTSICGNRYNLFAFRIRSSSWILPYRSSLWREALAEIVKRFPELGKYAPEGLHLTAPDRYRTVSYHPLLFLIAEDFGIEVIDYGQNGQWFQLLSPSVFVVASLVEVTK